jgi:uncharacterized coiled-coil protein SlyX
MTIDDRLARIEDKIDVIKDKVASIDATLASQHTTLEEHTSRSTNLEKRIIPLERQAVIFGALGKITLALLGSGTLLAILRLILHV